MVHACFVGLFRAKRFCCNRSRGAPYLGCAGKTAMITPIEYDDVFGYDDAGRPYAVQLYKDTYALGYAFCGAFKGLFGKGCQATYRLSADNAAVIFIYSPTSKEVEVWRGTWTRDESEAPHVYSIANLERAGLLKGQFENFESLKEFAKSDLTILRLKHGILPEGKGLARRLNPHRR